MTNFAFDFDLTENKLCGFVPTQVSALVGTESFSILEGNQLGYGCPTPPPTSVPTTPLTPKPSQSPTPGPTKRCGFGTKFVEVIYTTPMCGIWFQHAAHA